MANIQYAEDGTYNVKFKAEDTCGNKTTGTRRIVVNEREFTISFNSKGGSPVSPITVHEGDTATGFETSVKTGEAFKGWYDNAYCYGDPIYEIENVQQDYTLYAKWGEESYGTYVFQNTKKTLAINVPDSTKAQFIAAYGNIVETFPAWSRESEYIFPTANDVLWRYHRDVDTLLIASNIKPSNMNYWFTSMNRLTHVAGLDHIDTATCTSMVSTFESFQYMNKAIDVSSWNVRNVTTFEKMFHNAYFSTLDLANWRTDSATNMNYMFASTQLTGTNTKIEMNGWTFENVTDMGNMFSGCTVNTLRFENPDTSNCTNFYQMFTMCAVRTIISDDFDFSSATTPISMFGNAINVIGGNGTVYSSSHTEDDYAVVDTPYRAGYFTAPYSVKLHIVPNAGLPEYDTYAITGQRVEIGAPEIPGSYFVGWHQRQDLSDTAFYAFVPYYSQTLYGEWTPAQTLTYHQNNGEADVNRKVGTGLVVELDLVPTYEGYEFAGWYDNESLTGSPITQVTVGNTYIEVWAKWDEHIEGTHYLFADGVFATGVPADDVQTWVTNHGAIRGQWTNDCSSSTVPWYTQRSNIKQVLPGSGKARLCPTADAFANCGYLLNADISNLVGVETGHGREMNCDRMFSNCTSMASCNVDIRDPQTNVTSAEQMFDTCRTLRLLNLGNTENAWSRGALTNSDKMFYRCQAMQNFYLDNLNINNITDMGWMFYDCVSLQKVRFRADTHMEFCTNVTQLFSGDELLTEIENLDKISTSGEWFAGTFAGTKVTELNLKGFDTTQATSLNGMFKNCTRLVTIYGTDKLSNSTCTNYNNIFEGCTNLVGGAGTVWSAAHASDRDYLWLDGKDGRPGYVTEVPTTIYGSYNEDTGLFRLFRDEPGKYTDGEIIGNTKYWAGITGEQESDWYRMYGSYVHDPNKVVGRACTRFETDGSEMVFKIGNGMCTLEGAEYIDLTGVRITHDAERMFANTSSLQTLIVSDDWIDPVAPIDIHDLFAYSTVSTQDLNEALGKLSAVQVTSTQGAFSHLANATSVNMVELVGTNVTTAKSMFNQSRSLRTIIVDPNRGWDLSAGGNIGNQAFYECTNLVGGAGTGYASNHVGTDYFCIDNQPTKPGYLTSI